MPPDIFGMTLSPETECIFVGDRFERGRKCHTFTIVLFDLGPTPNLGDQKHQAKQRRENDNVALSRQVRDGGS